MSGRQDSNLRPPGPKPGDLPTDLLPDIRKSFGSFRVTGNNNASGFATINPFSRFKLLNYYYSFTTFSLAVHTRIELVAQHRQCRMLAITPIDQLWSRWDSNPHPLPCKGNAQPIELQPHLYSGRGSNPQSLP